MRIPGKIPNLPRDGAGRLTPGAVVQYEQHGAPALGLVLADKKSKWVIRNTAEAKLELPGNRLYLLPGPLFDMSEGVEKQSQFLKNLKEEAEELSQTVSLEDLWELVSGSKKERSVSELVSLYFSDGTRVEHLALRNVLLEDIVYFRRKKLLFEARPVEVVKELKIKARVEAEKREQREALVRAVLGRFSQRDAPLPNTICQLEQLAVLGTKALEAKEARAALEAIEKGLKREHTGKVAQRAFRLLVEIGHFSADENLTLHRLGRKTSFSEEEEQAAQDIVEAMTSEFLAGREDFTTLQTVSIDAADTKDIDDALSLEEIPGGYRLGVHIADVASLIPIGSTLWKTSFERATSVYTADKQISMLPNTLSEEALSLREGELKPAVSALLELNSSFEVVKRKICHSVIQVDKRLDYRQVDEVLFGESTREVDCEEKSLPSFLELLWRVSAAFEAKRLSRGAMQFMRREMSGQIGEDKKIFLEACNEDAPSRKLVAEMMVAANETAALFAAEKSIPLAFRSQEAPDMNLDSVGEEIPEGPAREYYRLSFVKRSVVSPEPKPHAGLGLLAYAHTTSPIRRAADLLNQKQIGEYLVSGSAPLTSSEVLEHLGSLAEGLSEANLIQRERNRYWLLRYLEQENIQEIEGVVTKIDGSRPMAELDTLHSVFPFRSPDHVNENGAIRTKKTLGERVRLKVETISARQDSLVLREI